MGRRYQISLADGRALDIELSGPDSGPVLVFLHGTPGARTPIRVVERAVEARGLQTLTMSRPGYGDSARHAGRSVVDVVADIEAVLGALSVERCVVAGWSGGGPHALACAARLDEARAVLVIAGIAPVDADGLDWMAGMGEDNVEEFGVAMEGELPLRQFLERVRPHLQSATAPGIVEAMSGLLPAVDRAVLTDEFGEDMASSFREALRVGVDGWLDDDLAFVRPWGFSLDEIAVPVSIWQGAADLMVPFPHGQWLARNVPNASAHLLEGEGHLSIGFGALEQMIEELVSSAHFEE